MTAPPADPTPDATRRALAEGAARFDAGCFFDAHEVWEDAWRVESGPARQLLQGLIQIAAGFHKGLVQGTPAGMAKLLATGLGRVEAAGDLGLVDLSRFTPAARAWRDAAARWAGGGPRPELPLPRFG